MVLLGHPHELSLMGVYSGSNTSVDRNLQECPHTLHRSPWHSAAFCFSSCFAALPPPDRLARAKAPGEGARGTSQGHCTGLFHLQQGAFLLPHQNHTSWGLGKVSPSFSAPPLPHTLTKGTLKSADRAGERPTVYQPGRLLSSYGPRGLPFPPPGPFLLICPI